LIASNKSKLRKDAWLRTKKTKEKQKKEKKKKT
jgi:hypothetical protein